MPENDRGTATNDAGAAASEALTKQRIFNEKLETFVKIGLIAGGIFAGLQYCSSIEQRRVERVLEYARELDSGEPLAAQRRIERELMAWSQRLQSNGSPPAREHILAEEKTMIARLEGAPETSADGSVISPDTPTLSSDIALIVGFMDKLNACTERKLCDGDLTQKTFRPFAVGVAKSFQCYFRKQRNIRPDYAEGLLSVAGIRSLEDGDAARCPDDGEPAE